MEANNVSLHRKRALRNHLNHIKNLKKGKATGLDGIGSRILKAGAPVLSIYLSKIFNCSLATGYVPKCWKMKRVSPVHKGDVKTDPSNLDLSQFCPYLNL